MKSSSVYLFAAVVVATVAVGSAVKCFKCDSAEESKCLDPFDKMVKQTTLIGKVDCWASTGSLLKTATGQDQKKVDGHCVKITEKDADGKVTSIVRTCGREDIGDKANKCETEERDGATNEVCNCNNEDGCNSAGAFGPAALAALLSALLAKMF